MGEQFARFRAFISTPRHVGLFKAVGAHVASLRAGDRAIAALLGFLVVASSLGGVYALTRAVLVEVPARGGTLTEGVLGSPRFVNPLLALSDADRDLVMLTYAGLMGIGEQGELVPVLAERYEISDDGTVYTFTLREDARFSDGQAVTSEDVVFTIERAQDPELKSPEFPKWSSVRAEAVDARTVRFTLPEAYAPFLANAALGILPAHRWRNVSNDEFPFSPLMIDPVGAGPFSVEEVRYERGVIREYVLRASAGYALGRPYLREVRFVFFSQKEDLERALARGEVESAYGIPAPDALAAPYARVFGVFFNQNQNPAFARIEVRKALSLALDRDQMIEEVLGGYATPAYGPVPPGSGVASPAPAIEALPEESMEEARLRMAAETLTDAGWEYDAEEREWTHTDRGLTLAVTLKTSNVPELKAVASAVRDDWAKLGVPVAIELYEPGDLTQNVIRPREYEALLFGMVVGRDHDLFAFWSSSERNDPGLNIALYANRVVDGILEEIRTAATQEETLEHLAEADAAIAADYPAAFTHAPDFLYVVPAKMRGVKLGEIASPSDRLASLPRWYTETESVWPFLVHSD